ncbi:MAG: hypothetical protein GY882_01970 [Actinomycetia bacterium]|nr:hypothetical protein [Actinomycetes bacterium]
MSITRNKLLDLESSHPASAEETAKAREAVQRVIGTSLAAKSSSLTLTIASVCRRVFTDHPDLQTWAVSLSADKQPVLLVNPEFTNSMDDEDSLCFLAAHEAMHLVLRHVCEGKELWSDPVYVQAADLVINYRVQRILKQGLPTRNGGEETGLNPKKTHEWVKRQRKALGLTPVTFEDMYRTDLACYQVLKELQEEGKERSDDNWCQHDPQGEPEEGGGSGQGSDPGQDGESQGTGPGGLPDLSGDSGVHISADQGAIEDLVEQALEGALKEVARNPESKLRGELEELLEMTGDSELASQMWSRLGAGQILGAQLSATRVTTYWDRKVRRFMAKALKPGTRMTFNKKLTGMGERRFTPRGKIERKRGVVAVDTSGSMSGVISQIEEMVGKTRAEVTWLNFDAACVQRELGDGFVGGGGTDASTVDAWIDENMGNKRPDFVLVVTDGYFQHFTPSAVKPAKWLWLVTKDGSMWMKDHSTPMKAVQLPF